jgi:hypothetical protein
MKCSDMDEIDQLMRFENTDVTILVMDENDHIIYFPHVINICFVHKFIIICYCQVSSCVYVFIKTACLLPFLHLS